METERSEGCWRDACPPVLSGHRGAEDAPLQQHGDVWRLSSAAAGELLVSRLCKREIQGGSLTRSSRREQPPSLPPSSLPGSLKSRRSRASCPSAHACKRPK